MTQSTPTKICLIGQSLASGGAEKAMGTLSFFLESRGVEVHHVIVLDQVDYPFAGKLLNLGKLKGRNNHFLDKAARFLALRRFLRRERFDCILDFRVRVSFVQELLIRRWLYDAPVFYTVHSAMLELYFPKKRWQARMVYGKAAGIVAVSNGIEAEIVRRFGLGNVTVIPNAIDLDEIGIKAAEPIGESGRFIVAAGRMDDGVKQFDKLIEAYNQSALPQKGIRLVLLGDGKLRPGLERNANENICFKGFVANPYAWFSKAEFTVLSSKREGLPMVILESLYCGTAVVSFDCVAGPAELIEQRKNGLLVPDQDFTALAKTMEELCDDSGLLERLRANARQSVLEYGGEKVASRWLSYLKNHLS